MDGLVGSLTAGPEPRGLPTYCSLAVASQEEFKLRSEGSPSWSLSGRPLEGKESVFGLRRWSECRSCAARSLQHPESTAPPGLDVLKGWKLVRKGGREVSLAW